MPPKGSKDFPWRIFIYQTVWNSNRFVTSYKYKRALQNYQAAVLRELCLPKGW